MDGRRENGNFLRMAPKRKDGDRRLVLVPSKFHKVVFLKKGDLVIVEMEPNMDKLEGKVVGSLVTPLQKQQVKHLHQKGLLPAKFAAHLDTTEEKKKPTLDDMMPPSGSGWEGKMELCVLCILMFL